MIILPLSSGALTGFTLPLHRRMLAELLEFKNISANCLDAVSDRDFIFQFVSTCSVLIMHMS